MPLISLRVCKFLLHLRGAIGGYDSDGRARAQEVKPGMKRDRHSDLIVVSYQPGARLRRFMILLGFSVAAGVAGFVLGLLQADFLSKNAAQTRAVLFDQVDKLRQENTQLKHTLVALERGTSIDQRAIQDAKRTIAKLETTVAQLNSDLGFYKSIMAPGEVEKSLQVQRMTLRSTGQEDGFNFKVSLTQVGDNRSYIAGLVAINVVGSRDGKSEVIPLRDLSEDIDELGVPFRFRYFQDFEGNFTLPDGFKAESIQIVAQAEGKKAARVERTFTWRKLVGE